MMRWLLVVALIAIVVGFHLATIRPGHDWTGDFALYIMHARNLVEGRAYGDTGYVYNPNFSFLSPPTYPPVFPLMLVPVYAAAGLNLVAMKAVGVVFFGLSLGAIHVALRDHLSFAYRLVLLVVIGLNPYFWQFKDQVLADLPFLFFCYVSLGLIHAFTFGKSSSNHRDAALAGAATGVMLLLTCGTRSVGLILLGAFLVYFALQARRIDLYAAMTIGVLALGIVLENLTLHEDSRYVDQLKVYFDASYSPLLQMGLIIRHWFLELRALWANGWWGGLTWALHLSIAALAVTGFILRVRRRGWSIFEVFALLYPAVVVLWPMGKAFRFLIPVIPLYVAYALLGGQDLGRRLFRSRLRRGAGWMAALVVLGSYGTRYATFDFGPIRDGIRHPDAVEMFQFIRNQTQPTAVVIFSKPRILALMTERRSACYSVVSDDIYLERFLAHIGATHLVTTAWLKSDRIWLPGFIERHPGQWELVFENATHRVYEGRAKEDLPDAKSGCRGSVVPSRDM